MRQVAVWMMVTASVLAAPVARADPPTDVLGYAVFGIQTVRIGAKGRVQGDVGCLFDELTLGQGTRVSGTAAAPSITLRNRARAGSYFCSTIAGTADACNALPNPLIDPGPTVVLATPGNLDVTAPKHTKAKDPLAAGAYGALSAGTAAEVLLAGGAYQFESIALGSRAKVICAAACEVTVRTTVTTKQGARLGAADTIAPSDVIVRIAGQEASTAFDAKSRTTVGGSVYAPSAGVKIGAGVRVTGSVVGNTVAVGPRARIGGPGGG